MDEPQAQCGPDNAVFPARRGRPFKYAGRIQDLWNSLVPTKQIAEELGFYSTNNLCRSVRAMRKLGYSFIFRRTGRAGPDGTRPVIPMAAPIEQGPPSPAQLAYWATVSRLVTERHALRRAAQVAEEATAMAQVQAKPIVADWFRCPVCDGRSTDSLGHPSCRPAA